MNIVHALVLGIIEGLTEFLPISSTAHMILVSKWLAITETDALRLFQIVIQIGAIAAVVVTYCRKLLDGALWKKLIVAFIPTGLVGFFVYPHLKFLFTTTWIIVATLFLGGVAILIIEKWYEKHYGNDQKQKNEITLRNALLLGCFQAFAIVPGVSRSGSVVLGGLLLGINRSSITEFTFLLAVPTMALATLYSITKNLSLFTRTETFIPILVGTVISFVVALVVIKKFLAYIRNRSFSVFGWYRIILAIVIALAII